jgi:hypothetical protein
MAKIHRFDLNLWTMAVIGTHRSLYTKVVWMDEKFSMMIVDEDTGEICASPTITMPGVYLEQGDVLRVRLSGRTICQTVEAPPEKNAPFVFIGGKPPQIKDRKKIMAG